MSNASQYFKETVGFIVNSKDDPDFLTWLMGQWKENVREDPGQTFSKLAVIEEFIKFSRNLISQKPVVAMEYVDTGIAIVLSTGEKIPFNKSSTIDSSSIAISVTGSVNTVAGPRTEPQMDTSAPITGGGN